MKNKNGYRNINQTRHMEKTEYPGIVTEKQGAYRDRFGRMIDLHITLATMQDLESCDFGNLTDKDVSFLSPNEDLFRELMENAPFMTAAVFVIAKDQFREYMETEANADGVSDRDKKRKLASLTDDDKLSYLFLDSIDGKVKDGMRRAFYEAMADFFPQMGSLLLNLVTTQEQAESELTKKLNEKIPHMMQKTMTQFRKGLTPFLEEMDKELSKED